MILQTKQTTVTTSEWSVCAALLLSPQAKNIFTKVMLRQDIVTAKNRHTLSVVSVWVRSENDGFLVAIAHMHCGSETHTMLLYLATVPTLCANEFLFLLHTGHLQRRSMARNW